MNRNLIAAIGMFTSLLCSSQAYAQYDTLEDKIAQAMMLYCIAPIAKGDDVAQLAVQEKLPEFPEEKANMFSKGNGRVFAVPGAPGEAVLIAYTKPAASCAINIRQADAEKFWVKVDHYFGEKTPFKKVEEVERPDNGIGKNFTADFHGPTVLMISMRPQPKENGLQGVMTFARIKEAPQ